MSRNLRGLSARKGVADGLYDEVVRAAGTGEASTDERLISVAGGLHDRPCSSYGSKFFL